MFSEKNKVILITALVSVAAITAGAYPFFVKYCAKCSLATEYLLPNADKLGLIFYLLLLAVIVRFKVNKFAQAGLFFACGVHAALMAKLVALHLFCAPCVLCASVVAIASFVAMSRNAKFVAAFSAVGALSIVGTAYVYQQIKLKDEDRSTKTALRFDKLNLKANPSVPIYVYQDPKCYSCREFMDLYVPRLASKYAEKITLHIDNAPGGVPTPTIVVGGAYPQLLLHKPEWFALTKVIDENIQERSPSIAESHHGRL